MGAGRGFQARPRRDIAVAGCAAMDRPGHPVQHLAARQEVHLAFCDHAKANRIFGQYPQTPLTEGLRRMAAWAQGVGIQSGKPFDAIEISRALPPSWQALLKDSPPPA